MANAQNLIPNSQRTPSELREMTSKGGKKSGEVRRQKASMKADLKAIMEMPVSEDVAKLVKKIIGGKIDIKNITNQQAVLASAYKEALKGNMQAIWYITKMQGEEPPPPVSDTNEEIEDTEETDEIIYGDN